MNCPDCDSYKIHQEYVQQRWNLDKGPELKNYCENCGNRWPETEADRKEKAYVRSLMKKEAEEEMKKSKETNEKFLSGKLICSRCEGTEFSYEIVMSKKSCVSSEVKYRCKICRFCY